MDLTDEDLALLTLARRLPPKTVKALRYLLEAKRDGEIVLKTHDGMIKAEHREYHGGWWKPEEVAG